ncbi:MAG TPA: DOMON-like domain-containing protein [Allosphingosinicella sp.]
MGHRLALHPDSVCESVAAIEVDVARTDAGILGLRYVVSGRIGALALAEPAASVRADRLWEHTCFEAFLADEAGGGYAELNVAPSTEWAGYRFVSYRRAMKQATFPPPRVEADVGAERLEMRVALQLNSLGRRRLGLSAVIEELSGSKSYWALAHPPGPPDFHHPDCFALELPPLG